MNKHVGIELIDGVTDFYGAQHLIFSVGLSFHTIGES